MTKNDDKTATLPTSIRFSEDEIALLDEQAEHHGGRRAALVEGLKALKAKGDITNEQLIAILRERLP